MIFLATRIANPSSTREKPTSSSTSLNLKNRINWEKLTRSTSLSKSRNRINLDKKPFGAFYDGLDQGNSESSREGSFYSGFSFCSIFNSQIEGFLTVCLALKVQD